MEVGGATPQVTVDPSYATEAVKARLQASMLRKSLDAQENEAAALLRMLEGKGQNLDIRV